MRKNGLQATIVQPAIVYGPYGEVWTERPVQMLLQGILVLPTPGDGICNAVYVDDVVHALILAAQADEAVGETMLISGSEHPTWADFYRAYERALGLEGAVRLMAHDDILARTGGAFSRLPGFPMVFSPRRLVQNSPLFPLLVSLYRRLGPPGQESRSAAV